MTSIAQRSPGRAALALLSALALALTVLPPTTSAASAVEGSTNVWINELHYDNASTDEGEFIEVAVPLGADLSGWSLVRYNGASGSVYDSPAGPEADLGALTPTGGSGGFGFVVVEYPVNGLQNGAPDGFALVDASGSAVQFLSYEGDFTAVGGPADGLTSADVGVRQTGAATLDPVGASIQLTGTGSAYDDFVWERTTLNTAGAVNIDQTLEGTGGDPVNAPVIPACEDLTVAVGESGAVILQASDADGVVSIATTSLLPTGLSLANEVVASESGGIYSVELSAADSLEIGTYSLDVTFANDDDDPQTATCTVEVTVRGDICQVPFVNLTPINEIQGPDATTPFDGQSVVTRGVVTADFTSGGASDVPANQGLRGFFLEAIEDDRDDLPETSEGVFVFDSGGTFDGAIGDLVYVSGTAGESFDVTQVTSGDVGVCADAELETTLPPPVVLDLPTSVDDRDASFEPTEAMRVTHDELTVVEFFQLERFGELRLSSDGVLQNPTNVVDPADDDAYEALVESNAANNIILDDGRTGQNLDPLPYVTEGDTLRIGDQALDETFVLHFGFGDWRLQPIELAELTEEFRTNRTRQRPEAPPEVGGSLTVGAFNVLNYFNGDGYFIRDDTETAAGFPTARGARNVGEFERQTEKIVDAIVRMDADILGLIEIENDGGNDQAAAALVDAVNAESGEGTYDYVDTGVIGTDAIKLAFIYKPSTVEPTGDYAVLDSSVDPRFVDTRNRPVLAQTFTEIATGEALTVANNHLKSKGSGCGAGDDDDRQGSCNGTRMEAAAALADWLASDPTGQDAAGSMIVGDLNSYAKEDPISVLLEEGYTDLLDAFAEDGVMPYTYTFDATQGYLDYALADEELFPFVTGAAAWNINADEVVAIDYFLSEDGRFRTEEVAERFYDPSAFRSSDHDPVLVGLDLRLASTASCKQGRWRSLFEDGEGMQFRNQGQCVSFVSSGELRGPSDAPGNGVRGRR